MAPQGRPFRLCADNLIRSEDEIRSVEWPDVLRGGPEGTAPTLFTWSFPFASSLDVAQSAKRLELFGSQSDLATGGEACRQRLVRLPLRLEKLGVLLH